MKLIAHRGYHTKLIKENTLESFDNAINNGFVGIECDVRVTKDKVLVINHDAFINGKLISMTNYDELHLPLLKDVLSRYKCIKLVELKTKINIDDILDLVDDNTYFMSFDSSYIESIKLEYPSIKVGVLNYVLNSKKNYDLDMICILDTLITYDLINYFISKNIKVFVYGINKKVSIKDDNLYYITDFKDIF